jgi:sec-independent protein translocase protein TatB
MLDFDISKMAVIGVVALVVLGPERLPRVSRTVGTLLGRAQRYIGDVRDEVERNIKLEEVRKMKSGIEEAASSIQSSIEDATRKHANEVVATANEGVESVQKALHDALPSIHDSGKKFEFAWQPTEVTEATEEGAELTAVAQESRPLPAQKTRTKRRVPVAGRIARTHTKRSRVVSMAASKALGRNYSRAV